MDYSPEFPSGKSPRRELQGPRPTPLKVRKDSHKIKKPPIVPSHQSHQLPHQQHHHHHRPPVIIYTVSPKVIHTNPSEFMTLVQRLTGPDPGPGSVLGPSSSNNANPSSSFSSFQDNISGAVSPAARFASVEKTKIQEMKKPQSGVDMDMIEGVEINTGFFPGILSPGPGSLPPIPPNFFSPSSDPNHLSFFQDLSPVLYSTRNYTEASFMPSPSNFLSPHITNYSPTPSNLDIFNNFFDL